MQLQCSHPSYTCQLGDGPYHSCSAPWDWNRGNISLVVLVVRGMKIGAKGHPIVSLHCTLGLPLSTPPKLTLPAPTAPSHQD
jgi:hypothetical protein